MFCNTSCANSIRELSPETKEKIGKKLRIHKKSNKIKNKKTWEDLSERKKKTLVKIEANWTCQKCNFNKRRDDGTSIIQIDHIDGDSSNNSRSNLLALCPNCHALTSTWGNKRGGTKRYSGRWINTVRNNAKFVGLIKEAYERKLIDFSINNWPEELIKYLSQLNKKALTYKRDLLILRLRKLLPRFYIEKCYNILNENDLFESKIDVDEYYR